ncbi:MAG: hypothetical protein EXR21_02795 [Flavobacteriaceae bacterium]|nr:hypothetical protein [Flavobacteriaceae bacterium]
MSYFTCSSGGSLDSHRVQLAESNNGYSWSSVPGFTSFVGGGSVPDVITRNNKLYLYTTSGVKTYDYSTNTWDKDMSKVSIVDSAGTSQYAVDPSMILDSSGRLVMLYLESSGPGTGDPAGCNGASSCTKYFRSAVEVPSSGGTVFVKQSGARLSYTITTSNGSASDPDIFFNGTQYILYISTGTNVRAYYSATLHGTYTAMPLLSSALLTSSVGIPCGYYDADSASYFTFGHTSGGLIQLKKHASFNSSISSFTTVVNYNTAGLSSTYSAQSPGFCKNTLTMAALPVKLLDFTGIENDEIIELNWRTASESNADGFVVERSLDGNEYTSVGYVKAVGNSNNINRYDFTENALLGKQGAYYRLTMVDQDGKWTYSNILFVAYKYVGLNFSVIENPFGNVLTLGFQANISDRVEVAVIDLFGHIVLQEQKEVAVGNSQFSYYQAADWAKGIYFISVKGKYCNQLTKVLHLE